MAESPYLAGCICPPNTIRGGCPVHAYPRPRLPHSVKTGRALTELARERDEARAQELARGLERDEARAEAERLRGVLSEVAAELAEDGHAVLSRYVYDAANANTGEQS